MPPGYGSCSTVDVMTTFARSSGSERTKLLHKPKVLNHWIPKRYVFSILAFAACCLAISFNINLSIAIISMVNPTHESNKTAARISVFEDDDVLRQNASQVGKDRLHWTSQIEGLALGSLYYGQLISFIPGGRLAELYGGKRMLIACMLVSSIATLFSPLTAVWSPYAFIADRILVGLGTGPIIPIVFYMLAQWIPENERSFHASFILSGYGIGSFLAVIVSGALCGTDFFGGWPSVFYTGGVCGILWCCACAYAVCENPFVHPTISDDELAHISQGLETGKQEKIVKLPWKEMALSVPLWALAFGFFGQFWLLGFFSTVHALYMGTVLNLPVVKNGVLSCLPHLLRAFATCIASYPVDIMLKKKLVSKGFVRKGATVINSVAACGAFLGVTFVGRNVTAATLLFILGGVLGEFVTFGVCMACIDIAPNLSGTVSGIINIVGVFPFFIIPALVGYFTNYENSFEQWRKVFYTSIAIVIASTIIFVIFGDLKPQSWGVAPDSESEEEGKEQKTIPKILPAELEVESKQLLPDMSL